VSRRDDIFKCRGEEVVPRDIEAALRGHCATVVEEHMVPKRVFIRAGLPLIGSGKINRRALRPPDGDPGS